MLPDTAKDKPARGTIVAVGDGKLLDDGTRGKLQVKVGDRVLFTSYAGDEFKVGDAGAAADARGRHPGRPRRLMAADARIRPARRMRPRLRSQLDN